MCSQHMHTLHFYIRQSVCGMLLVLRILDREQAEMKNQKLDVYLILLVLLLLSNGALTCC